MRDHNDRPLERLRLPGEGQYKLEGPVFSGQEGGEVTIIAMQTIRRKNDDSS